MSTYTTRNRLVKQAVNENKGTWGTVLNTGVIDTIDFSLDGVTSKALAANYALTTANGAADEARARTLIITSTGGADRIVTIPSTEKWYHVFNDGANRVTLKTATGVAVIVPPGVTAGVFCDGLDCRRLWQSDYGLITSAPYTVNSGTFMLLNGSGLGYKNFQLLFKGVSMNSAAAGAVFGLQVSGDGSNYSAVPLNIMKSADIAATYYGGIEFSLASADTGLFTSGIADLRANFELESDQVNTGSGAGQTPTAAVTGAWRHAGGISWFKINAGGGFTFDAGSIELYGK